MFGRKKSIEIENRFLQVERSAQAHVETMNKEIAGLIDANKELAVRLKALEDLNADPCVKDASGKILKTAEDIISEWQNGEVKRG